MLLTDEGERYPYPSGGRDDELACCREAFNEGAKAQLKKVVEEARNNGVIDLSGKVSAFDDVHYAFWQALLEEIQ